MELLLALPPADDAQQQAFLREVDENLRQDQLLTIWRNWGRWIVAAVIVGLLVFGGVLFFSSRDTASAETQGNRYDAALTQIGAGHGDQATAELEKLQKSGKPGYRAMARFAEADVLLDKKNLKAAAAKFAEVANDPKLDRPFRELALVRQTSAEFDTLKPQQVVDRLKDLAKPDSAFFGSAGEMVANAYLRLGKRDAAGKLYAQLVRDANVPVSIKERAVQMAGVLGVDAIDQTGDTKAQ